MTNSVILRLFPKTMQVPIIKYFMAPNTYRKIFRIVKENELLLLKKDCIFANKKHGQVLNDLFCNS